MNICGIIAEYNPFHKGHIYHLEQARKVSNCDCLVVITSGLFSQRGLPSYLSSMDKTRLALEHGANLVIELPVCFASQSADYFAKYAIQSLSVLGVRSLVFGSETNDIEKLSSIVLKEKDATKSLNENQNISLQPNDILGYQYIQYCKEYNITPISIQRNEHFKSATQTRKDALSSHQDFQEFFHLEQNWDSYYPYLRNYLVLTDAKTLSSFHLVNEGIENRLKEGARLCDSWNEYLEYCVTKTYSKARIQRTSLMILLQIKKEEIPTSFFGCKVLGFDSIGQQVLKENKEKEIYTKFADLPSFLKELELKTTYLYNSVQKEKIENSKVMVYDR